MDKIKSTLSNQERAKEWWLWPNNTRLHYGHYQIGDVNFYVGSRPDVHFTQENIPLILSIQGWLRVTDRFMQYPGNPQVQWLPWFECRPAEPQVIVPAVIMLRHWVENLGFKKIYIHCDAGTHRAPSVFGAYLKVFHLAEREEIVRLAPSRGRSDPNEYWDQYEKEFPIYKKMIECLRVEPLTTESYWEDRLRNYGLDLIAGVGAWWGGK